MDLQCCIDCLLPSDFSSKILSSMIVFHHKLKTTNGRVMANGWTRPSSMRVFVHFFIGSVIRKVTTVTLNTISH